MRDIVKRLRKLAATADRVPIFADAADEIERLKAALREIADHKAAQVSSIHAIARAALEEKFPTKKICPECGQPMREGGVCDHIPF